MNIKNSYALAISTLFCCFNQVTFASMSYNDGTWIRVGLTGLQRCEDHDSSRIKSHKTTWCGMPISTHRSNRYPCNVCYQHHKRKYLSSDHPVVQKELQDRESQRKAQITKSVRFHDENGTVTEVAQEE